MRKFKTSTFALGVMSGVALSVFFAAASLAVYLHKYYRQNSPTPYNSSIKIKEITQTQIPSNTLPSEPCQVTEFAKIEAVSVHRPLSDSVDRSEPNPDFPKYCDEYKLTDTVSIVNNKYFGSSGTLILKQKLENKENNEYVFRPMFTHQPSRFYELLAVEKTGRMFIKYGGYEYFGKDRSGELLYELDPGLILLDKTK